MRGVPRRGLAVVLLTGVLVVTGAAISRLASRSDRTDARTSASTQSRSHPAPAPGPIATGRRGGVLSLVALGDSVPAGTACGCEPYPQVFGASVGRLTGRRVTTRNLAVPGETSAQLLAAVDVPSVRHVLERADIVSVNIGANDFSYVSSQSCPNLRCYRGQLRRLGHAVTAILGRIRSLRHGRPTAVRVVNYWAVWKDGDVGRAQGADYMSVNQALTNAVNSTLQAASQRSDVDYVNVLPWFRNSDRDADDTELLAADGDHPNAKGHQRIASALLADGVAEVAVASPGYANRAQA